MDLERDRLPRVQLVRLLGGGNTHTGFAAAVADFPEPLANARPPNVDYTLWRLVEHLRLTQADILEYITTAAYRERDWPRECWLAGSHNRSSDSGPPKRRR